MIVADRYLSTVATATLAPQRLVLRTFPAITFVAKAATCKSADTCRTALACPPFAARGFIWAGFGDGLIDFSGSRSDCAWRAGDRVRPLSISRTRHTGRPAEPLIAAVRSVQKRMLLAFFLCVGATFLLAVDVCRHRQRHLFLIQQQIYFFCDDEPARSNDIASAALVHRTRHSTNAAPHVTLAPAGNITTVAS